MTHAQGRRRPVDDDVDLDDEEYFDDAQASPDASEWFDPPMECRKPHTGPTVDTTHITPTVQGSGVIAILQQAWGVVGGFTERLADVAYDYVPDSVSRSTVCSAPSTACVLISHTSTCVTSVGHLCARSQCF